MKITLKSLNLTYFKGIIEKEVIFKDHTIISGRNGLGKTTIFDAFLWLLNGKDHLDRADYKIKTLNPDNTVKEKIDHEVKGVILQDEAQIKLARIYREKWQTKRGEQELYMTGHETAYKVNEVPTSQTDYKSAITNIIAEEQFKIFTNPMYFNGILSWDKRREYLTEMAGNVENESILKKKKKVEDLLSSDSAGKTINQKLEELKASKKLKKELLKEIKPRTDEVMKQMPKPLDFDKISEDISKYEKELETVFQHINDKYKATEKIRKDNDEVNEKISECKRLLRDKEEKAESKWQEVEFEKVSQKETIKRKILQLGEKIESDKNDLFDQTSLLTNLNKRITALREEYKEIDAEKLVFDKNEFKCPTCEREYDAEDIESKKTELTENFNTSKRKKLDEINSAGKRLKEQIKGVEEEIKALNKSISDDEKEVDKLNEEFVKFPESAKFNAENFLKDDNDYNDILKEIEKQEKLLKEVKEPDTENLQKQQTELNAKLDSLKADLGVKETIERLNKRLEEINQENRKLSQEVADIEKQEDLIEDYTKSKNEEVEKAVNKLFKSVKFKLFESQINGGYKDICDCLINGVPFDAANTGAQINAGVECINVLSEFYDIYAPIFVDHSESIDQIIETKSQLVELRRTDENELTIKYK
jgi:DNA repair protein SbcC/Rad50